MISRFLILSYSQAQTSVSRTMAAAKSFASIRVEIAECVLAHMANCWQIRRPVVVRFRFKLLADKKTCGGKV